MADDERRDALLARELGEERVDGCGAELVELAGGLVGDQEPGPVGERGAERDPLLLSAGELAGMRVGAVAQSDALEEAVGSHQALAFRDALEPERNRDQLLGGQLARERAPVVLVGVPERGGAVVGEPALRERSELQARDADAAGARTLESGQHAHQRRLARSARTEDDADLAFLDVEREALQGGDTTVGSGIDAEEIAGLDQAHVPASCARAGPRSSRKARRVASATSPAATSR